VIRSVLAVLLGYVVFVLSASALFAVSGRDPHSQASAAFTVFAIAYGACFGVVAGLVAAWIARRAYFTHAFIVGVHNRAGRRYFDDCAARRRRDLDPNGGHGAVRSVNAVGSVFALANFQKLIVHGLLPVQ
jgi:hypothetical protein